MFGARQGCVFILLFTGLAYGDIFKIKTEHRERWILSNRQQTKTRSAIPLLPTAIKIIDKYIDHPICINKDSYYRYQAIERGTSIKGDCGALQNR